MHHPDRRLCGSCVEHTPGDQWGTSAWVWSGCLSIHIKLSRASGMRLTLQSRQTLSGPRPPAKAPEHRYRTCARRYPGTTGRGFCGIPRRGWRPPGRCLDRACTLARVWPSDRENSVMDLGREATEAPPEQAPDAGAPGTCGANSHPCQMGRLGRTGGDHGRRRRASLRPSGAGDRRPLL